MPIKTFLWGHPWRIALIFISLLIGGIVAAAPVWIGMLGMHMQEAATGVQANEGNSAWGVLPWLGMVTLPIYALVATLTVATCIILLVIDVYRKAKSR